MTSPSRLETLPAEKAGRMVANLVRRLDESSPVATDDVVLLVFWEVASLLGYCKSTTDQWETFRRAYFDTLDQLERDAEPAA